MIYSQASLDSPPAQAAFEQAPNGDVADLAAQLELLALNSAIESTANSEGTKEAAPQLAALDQMLREVQAAVAWQPGEALDTGALGRELSELARRVGQAVGSFEP
jgi:hypothetical protein